MKQHLLLFLFLIARLAGAQDVQSLDVLLLDARYDEVLKLSDTMLEKTSDPGMMASLKNKKAEALIRLGQLDQAATILQEAEEKAAESGSLFQSALTQSNYGLLHLNLGRNDLALDALHSARDYFEQSGKAESLEAAQALAHLGNLYRATGKYTQAEEQLNRALSIRLKLLKPNSEYVAASYNDLGLIFGMTNPDKALDYYEKALAIYKALHPGDHPKIAIANTNVGFIYASLELYGDAVNNFESALRIWEKVYHQPHASKAFVLFNLGQTYMKMQDHKAARGYYDRALAMYGESYGKKHPDIARVLNAIGDLDVAERKYDTALGTYQQALSANVSRFNETALAVNPASKDFYDGNVLLFTLVSKAEALESRYVNKTLKFQDLTLALQTLQVCDTLIDKLRQQITNESDKITLGNIASEVYANGVRIAYETAQVALRRKEYLSLSFYFAEKSKSAVLLDAISDANAKSFAGIPNDLLEEENNLKSAIAH
ncbi:MAG TPA: tetratricopeptide repeat protein, partial [Ohtaekwangia sp.]|nr:tetratricopeptide repeat protein [Ohtaekwangia sp.]